MIDFFRQLVAAPLRVIAWVLYRTGIADALIIIRLVCRVTGDVDDWRRLLIFLCRKEGIEKARFEAEKMIARFGSAKVSATIAWVEINDDADSGMEFARRWIKEAKEKKLKDADATLDLELCLSTEAAESERVIEEILNRNDLRGETTRFALIHRARLLASNEQWAQAEKVVDRILAVEENFDARLVKWVTCYQNGLHGEAHKNLREMLRLPLNGFHKSQLAWGWLTIGDKLKAMEWLRAAEKDGEPVSDGQGPLAELARSREYQAYFEARE